MSMGTNSAWLLALQASILKLLRQPHRAEQLCRAALETDDFSVSHYRAHNTLAELTLPGEDYFQVLTRIHAHMKPATYLEIGIDQGRSFEIVDENTLALGIDPDPHPRKRLGPRQRVYAETSDDFFAQRDLISELGGRPLDLAFIDGMHHVEYALRDFINIERYCTPESVVLIHDVYPIDAVSAARERTSCFWTGDIWRLILILKKYRPDLTVNVIGTRPSGLGMVQNLDPTSRVLIDNIDDILEEFLALDISVLDRDKDQQLNLFPNDWTAIVELIDRDRTAELRA